MRLLARKMESSLIACAAAVESWPEMYSGRLGFSCRASLVELNVKTTSVAPVSSGRSFVLRHESCRLKSALEAGVSALISLIKPRSLHETRETSTETCTTFPGLTSPPHRPFFINNEEAPACCPGLGCASVLSTVGQALSGCSAGNQESPRGSSGPRPLPSFQKKTQIQSLPTPPRTTLFFILSTPLSY